MLKINNKYLMVQKYYQESEVESGLDTVPANTPTKPVWIGNKDRKFRVITAELNFNELGKIKFGLWKFTKGLMAFLVSLPLVTLFIPGVRNMWKEAISGKVWRQINLLLPETQSDNTARRINEQGISQLNQPVAAPVAAPVQALPEATLPLIMPIVVPSGPISDLNEKVEFDCTAEVKKQTLSDWLQSADKNPEIASRFDSYDRKILLKQRVEFLARFDNKNLQVRDLEDELEKSAIKIVAYSDAEIASLTLDDVKKMTPRQLEILNGRSTYISAGALPSEITAENFNTLKLSEFAALSGQRLSEYLDQIPEEMQFLIKDAKLGNIDISKLVNDKLFARVFLQSGKIAQLSNSELKDNLPRLITLASAAFAELTQEQVKSLDLGEESVITAEILDIIIKNHSIVLNEDQIISVLNNNILSQESAELVTPKQMAKIDFNKLKVTDQNKELVECFFKNKIKIPNIQLNCLNTVLPYIIYSNLVYLSKDQVEALDFTKPEINVADILSGLVASPFIQHNKIPFLIPSQIIDALNHNTLSTKTSLQISKEQIQGMDFRLVNFNDANRQVIKSIFIVRNQEKISAIHPDSVNHVLPLAPHCVGLLSKEQVNMLDFTSPEIITKDVLKYLNQSQTAVNFLTTEQVFNGLNSGTLNEGIAEMITPVQIAGIDFNKVTANGHKLYSALLNTQFKIDSVQEDSLDAMLPHLDDGELKQRLEARKVPVVVLPEV